MESTKSSIHYDEIGFIPGIQDGPHIVNKHNIQHQINEDPNPSDKDQYLIMIKNSENIGERTNKSQFFRGRYIKLTSNIIPKGKKAK